MDIHSVCVASPHSALAFNSMDRAEDSGYYTTPSSLECSNITSNFSYPSLTSKPPFSDDSQIDSSVTPDLNFRPSPFCNLPINDISTDTPPRRPSKRPYSSVETFKPNTTIPTPTTLIAGQIQSLEVNEDKENSIFMSTRSPARRSSARVICMLKNVCENSFTYPITPVKRNCRSSPCKRSAKRLDFAIHTLSCEKHELLPLTRPKVSTKLRQPIARPNQKTDIISLLSQKSVIPPLNAIFQHLSNEDICNFCLVSPTWKTIWDSHKSRKMEEELRTHLKTAQENQENIAKDNSLRKKCIKSYETCLKEIHNELYENPVINSANPQYSPRTNRFRKFTKSASLDSRLQLPCVRCSHPAKVTEEATGEQWVQCTSATCCFQYCRYCNSSRHPGKTCCQYDLDAPSPSKRKKCDYAVGTRKSKKNLRRLL